MEWLIWDQEDENGNLVPREMTPEEIVLLEASRAVGEVREFGSLDELKKYMEEHGDEP